MRPSAQPVAVPQNPLSPAYDPYAVYYPSPMGMVLDVMLISSFMHMLAPPASIMVVHPSGALIGGADTIASQPEAVRMDAHDPGTVADTGGDDAAGADTDAVADDGAGDFGDTDLGGGGGDFDGGDFGGGDFGGGDFGD